LAVVKNPFFALKNKDYTTHHKKDKEVLRIVLVGPPVSTVGIILQKLK